MAVSDKFMKPFYKLFCRQLDNSQYYQDGIVGVKLENGKVLEAEMVWIQGRVTSANIEEFFIQDIDNISIRILKNKCTSDICEGQYVQVIGQVVATSHLGFQAVSATKICDLSSQTHAQQMWESEVIELQNLLMNKIQMIL